MATVLKMVKDLDGGSRVASAEDMAEVARDTPVGPGVCTGPDYAGKFKVVSAGDLSRREPPEWLVKGVLPKADVAVMFGASGSGKSFVGMDMGAAIARGIPWRRTTALGKGDVY